MKKFAHPAKARLYFLYRLISPILDPVKFFVGIKGYFWFIHDFILFSQRAQSKLQIENIFPQLHDKTELTPFDSHYFYQQLWAFEKVLQRKPQRHVDISSTYQMSGYISKVVPTTFIDYRPINAPLPNLTQEKGDITNLEFSNDSVESLSCLHVVEHIGLGRYGDPIDPDGYKKAIGELARVLAQGGYLYFSTPIGKSAIYFNAHRVFAPNEILELFTTLKLVEFSVVDDSGIFHERTDPKLYAHLDYGCGMFVFTKQ